VRARNSTTAGFKNGKVELHEGIDGFYDFIRLRRIQPELFEVFPPVIDDAPQAFDHQAIPLFRDGEAIFDLLLIYRKCRFTASLRTIFAT